MDASERLTKLTTEREASNAEHLRAVKETDRYYEDVFRPYKAAWRFLKKAITDAENVERISDDLEGVAAALETLAKRAKAASYDTFIMEAAKQDESLLESLKLGDDRVIENMVRDTCAIFTILTATLDESGVASRLVPHLSLGGSLGNAVDNCEQSVKEIARLLHRATSKNRHMTYSVFSADESNDPSERTDAAIPNCKLCGSCNVKVASTRGRLRHLKCKDCGHPFKASRYM